VCNVALVDVMLYVATAVPCSGAVARDQLTVWPGIRSITSRNESILAVAPWQIVRDTDVDAHVNNWEGSGILTCMAFSISLSPVVDPYFSTRPTTFRWCAYAAGTT
jgi:hypothetical protein